MAPQSIPSVMRAVVLTGHGDLDRLVYREDWPRPVPGPDEVLIRVGACGLNNTDVNTRTAWYSKGVDTATTGAAFDNAEDADATWGGSAIRFPRVQGADVAGRVVAVGARGDGDLVGARVLVDPWLRDYERPGDLARAGYFGSECDGGFADYSLADRRNVHAIESELSDSELATFATAYVTAENMLNRAGVGAGDRVAITGASGGVGSALIQLARRRGAETIALCRPAKAEAVHALGPDHLVTDGPDGLAALVKTVTVVADVVGGAEWPRLIETLARGGRYVISGAIGGPMVPLDLRRSSPILAG